MSQILETKETWQLNAVWVPELDSEPAQGTYLWQLAKTESSID